jgi:hypothetical protein
VEEGTVELFAAIFGKWGPVAMEDDKRVMRFPTPSPSCQVPGRKVISGSEKAEALADSLHSQFQPVNDSSDQAIVG